MSAERYAFLLAGGLGSRLCLLSEKRAKPAVPFGGKYRIIDFTLSNCVNSGIFDVGVLTQYKPGSLRDHIGSGRPWDLDRNRGGVTILQPFQGSEENDWYRGTADAVYQNLVHIRRRRSEDVLVLSGDHIYKMDYDPMYEFHRDRRAAVTLAVTTVPEHLTDQFGIVELDPRGRVVGFQEKPPAGTARTTFASMGVYLFRRDVLEMALAEDAEIPESEHDFGKDLFPRFLARGVEIYAHLFPQYWQDVGTLDSFYRANMELLSSRPPIELADPEWIIHTVSLDLPPVKVGAGASLAQTLAANGVRVDGTVARSILFPGVVIEPEAVVQDSILMHGTRVLRGAVVRNVIADKQAVIGAGAKVGGPAEPGIPKSRICPEHLASGLTILGRGARLPEGIAIGRNCRIDPDVVEEDCPGSVADGDWVAPSGPKMSLIHGHEPAAGVNLRAAP
ncbi:MAG: glucose-1-phosphate adenylyltransferase family protein [Candidatus Eiseniibacteriota bacterium]